MDVHQEQPSGESVMSTSPTLLVQSWMIIIGLATLVVVLRHRSWFQKSSTAAKKLPPGPPAWPIFGSLFYLKPLVIHTAFTNLARKYGPIVHLRLGVHPVVILSSVELADELFKVKDAEFASRPNQEISRCAAKYCGFDSQDIAFSSYTPRLTLFRKICSTELFTTASLKRSEKIRRDGISSLLRNITEAAGKGGNEPVDMRDFLFDMVTTNVCQMVFGKKYLNGPYKRMEAYGELTTALSIVIPKFNIADMIPGIDWLDPMGVVSEYKSFRTRAEKLLREVIDVHRQARKIGSPVMENEEPEEDFVDLLLSIQEEEKYPDMSIMGVLNDMMIGGIETTAVVLEWTLTELIRKPHLMERLQQEITAVVGKDRPVEESDIAHFHYLEAVMKESFRLHNTLPLLLPRMNEEAATLGGYDIPARSSLFVNTYAITRDPAVYENPLEFNPDRFLEGKVALHGRHSQLLPFGSGRRICVGMNLGLLLVNRVLASIVHAMDLSPHPTKPEGVSDEEGVGVILRKLHPLVVAVKPRLDVASVYKT